jgi:hypothetical protein
MRSNAQKFNESVASTKVTFNLENRPVSIEIQSKSTNNEAKLSAKVDVNGNKKVNIVELGVSCVKGPNPVIHINFIVLENLREGLKKFVDNTESGQKLEVLKKIVAFLFCHVIEHINKNIYKKTNANIPVILHVEIAHKNNPILVHIAREFGLVQNQANFKSSTQDILKVCSTQKERLMQKFFEQTTQTLTGLSSNFSSQLSETPFSEPTTTPTTESSSEIPTETGTTTQTEEREQTEQTEKTEKTEQTSTTEPQGFFSSIFGTSNQTATPSEISTSETPSETSTSEKPSETSTSETSTSETPSATTEQTALNTVIKDLQSLVSPTKNKNNKKNNNTKGGQYGYYRTRPTFYL